MNYAVEMHSGPITHIVTFIYWFSHSKVNRGGCTQRHTDRKVIS
jgi:hypothetical protein